MNEVITKIKKVAELVNNQSGYGRRDMNIMRDSLAKSPICLGTNLNFIRIKSLDCLVRV